MPAADAATRTMRSSTVSLCPSSSAIRVAAPDRLLPSAAFEIPHRLAPTFPRQPEFTAGARRNSPERGGPIPLTRKVRPAWTDRKASNMARPLLNPPTTMSLSGSRSRNARLAVNPICRISPHQDDKPGLRIGPRTQGAAALAPWRGPAYRLCGFFPPCCDCWCKDRFRCWSR